MTTKREAPVTAEDAKPSTSSDAVVRPADADEQEEPEVTTSQIIDVGELRLASMSIDITDFTT